MALDPQYLDAIKGFEGYAPNASWDYKQYSSGYGTKAQPGDENIPADQRKAVYEQRFQDEIAKAAASVDAFSPNLPPGVRAALTSLTYNAGPAWQQSGLGQAVKSGDFDAAKSIFLQYNKAGGEVNKGLVSRRAAESGWWGGSPQPAPVAPAIPSNGLLQQPAPAGLLNQPAPMGLLTAPTAQPVSAQPAQQQEASSPSQMQMPQAPPIFYAPRRAPDMRALQAQLRSPLFSRG